MKVLVVDDSVELCKVIRKILLNHHYEVDCAHDGHAGLRMALSNEYDIILLDVMMPQMNGYRVLEKLRAAGRTTPVIMITAKNDVSDKIQGLELGADDYLQKPFNMNELTARMRALARRSNIYDYESDTLRYADISLVISTRKLSKDGLQITLSPQECEIMQYLIKNSDVIVPAEKLQTACRLGDAEEGTLPAYIECIQKMLQYICSKVNIFYIREVGYKLCY